MLFSIKGSCNNNLTTKELSTMQLEMKIYRKTHVCSHGVAFPSAIENQVLTKSSMLHVKRIFRYRDNLLS